MGYVCVRLESLMAFMKAGYRSCSWFPLLGAGLGGFSPLYDDPSPTCTLQRSSTTS